MQVTECKQDSDDTIGEGSSSRDGSEPWKLKSRRSYFLELLSHLREESREWWQVENVTGERVEQADGGVVVPLQDEGALVGIENAVVVEQRDVDADEGSRVEVEEADVAVQLGVAGVEAVAFGQQRPMARVEAWFDDPAAARGGGAGSPRGANGAEVEVVQQVAGQKARREQANQIIRQRRPGGR
jgi:hypothetical protein